MTGAVVQITGNNQPGEDVLHFTNQNGITGSFDQATGTLTLSGNASVASYQAALGSITYSDISQNPNTGARTVTFEVTDANNLISTGFDGDRQCSISVLTNDSAVTVNEGGTVAITSSALNYTDAGNNPATMTYTLTTAPQNGQFELTTNPGSAITSFTQADINAGSVVYVHNGSNTNSMRSPSLFRTERWNHHGTNLQYYSS